MSFVVIGFNIILKEIIIWLITWVGEASESDRLTSVTMWVFAA